MDNSPRKPAKKTRGKPFERGNPGKPKGARRRTTVLAEQLMEGEAEEVVQAVLDKAKTGDMAAARIVLDRVAPARRDRPIEVSLPKIESAADAAQALSAVLSALGDGAITPGEAGEVAKLIQSYAATLEVRDLEARIVALEERAK
ncbi:hypothetical protein [Methylocystis parvus]|uniref:hypothetical protein n=1 Tax=Methylocystis parvus TaxID=134 RepID=UPI003C73A941